MFKSTLSAMVLMMTVGTAMADVAPSVSMEITDLTTSSMTLTFTPNEATDHYYACQFGEGEFESQYNMFGAWMGFTCEGDMVKAWGYDCQGVETKVWKDCMAGYTYEIYVLPTAADGTYGDLQVFTIKTKSVGGEGPAEISIEVGQFGGDAENGYWQQIIYTPNENVAVFFDMTCTQEFVDENGIEGMAEYLKVQDDPSSPYYHLQAHFGVDDAYWNSDPSTVFYAAAIGKNINGEWGELSYVKYTTPEGTTAIEHINNDAASATTYNLNGMPVNEGRGLLIRGGRKVIIK